MGWFASFLLPWLVTYHSMYGYQIWWVSSLATADILIIRSSLVMHWLAQSVKSQHIGSNLVSPGPAPGPGWLRSLWTSSPAQTLTWPSSQRLWGRPPEEDGSQDSFSKLQTLLQIGGVYCRVVLRWSLKWIKSIIYRVSIFKIPHPLPQPSGCRADTQIACPGSDHRICNVQRCDGEEDCPRLPGQEISWDESEGCVTTTTPSSVLSTTTSIITTTTGAVQKWAIFRGETQKCLLRSILLY